MLDSLLEKAFFDNLPWVLIFPPDINNTTYSLESIIAFRQTGKQTATSQMSYLPAMPILATKQTEKAGIFCFVMLEEQKTNLNDFVNTVAVSRSSAQTSCACVPN